MSYFRVDVGSLMGAGHAAGTGGARGDYGAGLAGAGAGTPAAAACQDLVGRLETAATTAEEGTLALAAALLEAASNYQVSDRTAAVGVSPKGGGG